MSTVKAFEDLNVWQKARAFASKVFELSLDGTFAKDYSLKDQINRSCGSVMDNIAEGFERGGNREFVNFLSYAKGSAGEARSQIYRAFDRRHIHEATFNLLKQEVLELSKMLGSFMTYLQSNEFRGSKFHEPGQHYRSLNEEQNVQPLNFEP